VEIAGPVPKALDLKNVTVSEQQTDEPYLFTYTCTVLSAQAARKSGSRDNITEEKYATAEILPEEVQ
jgi:hypothetical protein